MVLSLPKTHIPFRYLYKTIKHLFKKKFFHSLYRSLHIALVKKRLLVISSSNQHYELTNCVIHFIYLNVLTPELIYSSFIRVLKKEKKKNNSKYQRYKILNRPNLTHIYLRFESSKFMKFKRKITNRFETRISGD